VHAWIKIAHEAGVRAGDADVYADCARLDHLSRDQSWPASRGNDNVSRFRVAREVESSGVTERDRGVLALAGQQQPKRPANRSASADHTDLRPIKPDAITSEQLNDATRRTRQWRGRTKHQFAQIDRMKPIRILIGIDQAEGCSVIEMSW